MFDHDYEQEKRYHPENFMSEAEMEQAEIEAEEQERIEQMANRSEEYRQAYIEFDHDMREVLEEATVFTTAQDVIKFITDKLNEWKK